MLLEFKIKNYKSFLDETVFSMVPAPKQSGLSYSLLKEKINKEPYKGLSTAVIYGPNAAGKSNILGAMDVLQKIILRGNIRNVKEPLKNLQEICSNLASLKLELIPNNTLKKKEPVMFAIKFIEANMLFEYILELDLGEFSLENSGRKILKEVLYVNKELKFERGEDIKLGENLEVNKASKSGELLKPEVLSFMVKQGLNDDELFLTNGFKTIIAPNLTKTIIEWFRDKLTIIYNCNDFEPDVSSTNLPFEKQTLYIQKFIDDAAKRIGITSNHLGYLCDENRNMVLTSIFEQGKEKGIIMPADVIESLGTIKFIKLMYPLMHILRNGGTLVIDELENSLHPMIVMNIINIFHNDDINKNKAQLIFNTHNPIFLNKDLLRRDEIKFVERDEDGYSTHYSLSDIVFPDNTKVRKVADYMKNYFVNKYGAIRNIDLSGIFSEIVNNKNFRIIKEEPQID